MDLLKEAYEKWKTCVNPDCEHDVFRTETELKECLFCGKHLTKEQKALQFLRRSGNYGYFN